MSDDVEILQRRCQREREARKQAEQLLEEKTREVFHANASLREMAERLSEQAELSKAIFETAAEGIVTYNEEGVIESFNQSAKKIFRCKSAVGAPVQNLFQSLEGNFEFLFPEVADVLGDFNPDDQSEPEVREPAEVTAVRSTGKAFMAEIAVSRLSRGGATCFTMLVRDLSRRKKLEARLSQAQKMESIGQLAAGIAHEINTPIQFVGDNISFLEGAFEDLGGLLDLFESLRDAVAEQKPTDELLGQINEQSEITDLPFLREELPGAIKQSIEGIDRVSTIVRAMKDFSQSEAECKTSVNLNHALEDTLLVSANLFRDVAQVQREFDTGLPPTLCLPGQINQALLNILANAAEAIGEKHGQSDAGLVRISTAADVDAIEIRISDNGIGISPEIQDRIFDPFFTTKAVGKGTGQGLAFVYHVVVDKHDGSIQVHSSDDGTTFVVRIPLSGQAQSKGATAC
ncbi:MAG: ATP-binding protein [Pirellulales bacterium]|nr:ATP-binding protein [Pirellulales bacterium]